VCRAVDVWALGCLMGELLTGEPVFPGESDLDQLHLIMRCLGSLCTKYRDIFSRNSLYTGVRLPEMVIGQGLEHCYPHMAHETLDIIKASINAF
jgi:cyclin-dependent kinase-like